MIHLPDIKNADVKGKTVFLRADLDVPLSGGKIGDDTRLVVGLPTIQYLLENGAKVIIGGHLGRPVSKYPISNIQYQISNEDKEFSLRSVANWFAEKLEIGNWKLEIGNYNGFLGWEIMPQLFLLENLRFYEGEETNPSTGSGLEFAKKLASLANIYVNDAFAMSHRSHASVVGICDLLPHFAGLHLQKEVSELSGVLENPKRPLVVVIGGKKVETKLPLVEKMHQIADYVLVGGKIAQEKGIFIKVQHEKIKGRKSVLLVANTNEDGSDITEKDAENFVQIINLAKTVVWNGPMGVIDQSAKIKDQKQDTEIGTKIIAQGIVDIGAYSVVGGGDTTEFLKRIHLYNKFNFVSTGGGAMLSFLSGEKLPGLQALLK